MAELTSICRQEKDSAPPFITHIFAPIAFESLVPINQLVLDIAKVGRCISTISGEPL